MGRMIFLLIFLFAGCSGGGGTGAGVDTSSDGPIVVPEGRWTKVKMVGMESAGGMLAPRLSAAIDSSGVVHLAYFDNMQYPSYTINHLLWDMESSSLVEKEEVLSIDNSKALGLAIDNGDVPAIVYQGGALREAGSSEQSDAMFNIRQSAWQEYSGGVGEVVRNPVFKDGLAGADLSITFDGAGDIHICYQFRYEGIDAFNYAYPDLLYVKKSRNNLSGDATEEIVEGNVFNSNGTASLQNNAGSFCKIIIDSNNNPVIFYYSESSNLKGLRMARKESGKWIVRWVETGVVIGGISTPGIDKSGRLGVAYNVVESDDGEKNYLKYVYEQSSDLWKTEIVDDSVYAGRYSALAYDLIGLPGIAYYAEQSYTNRKLKNLRFAHFDGNSWKIETVVSSGDIGTYNSLWFDADDNANIVTYSESDKSIYVVRGK